MRGIDLDLGRSTVLDEWLSAHTTSKLAVEDKVIILQILILFGARCEANLRQAVACHTSLAVCHRGPCATTHLGGGTGHTAEMTTFACQRTNTGNLLGTT
jgi:hypothetical protein